MAGFLMRLVRLVAGLGLFALGIVMTIRAGIGYAPWDVFHAGLGTVTGLSFGLVSILVGLALLVITVALGESLGLGTILNMVLIGAFIDLLLGWNLVPAFPSLWLALPLMVGGLLVIACGSWLYLGSGFGAGPRDSLMLALHRRTGAAIGLIRGLIEVSVLGIGCLAGGLVGFGTLVAALGIGPCVQLVFRLVRFDAKGVRHQTLAQTWADLRSIPNRQQNPSAKD